MNDQLQGIPEIWGGIECTINRVNGIYHDQLEAAGHYYRRDDIDLIAGLGIKALRHPVLWERHQPTETGAINWAWATGNLEKIRSHNIRPIVGLLHHGSGPAYTNLLDEKFPAKLAGYASRVAKQFPWIEHYTPVNEPLTTARFSGLYGYWYPHKTNDAVFMHILLNELKAIVLSMQEIRKINPAAKLVQTEDLAKTYSTPLLSYQADFENQRRWLTYDLLTGKMLPGHPLWKYCLRLGIPESALYFFSEHVCIPDIAGVNYYVTSERYLDQRVGKYHPSSHGTNGIHNYADVEAVRVPLREQLGFEGLIQEFWQRYQLPIALTEVHLGCTPDEQLRWFHEIWKNSNLLIHQGIEIKAVTAWALLGSFGWNNLLTCGLNTYESGVFKIEGNKLSETLLSEYIKSVARSENYENAALDETGWWKKPSRFFPPPARHTNRHCLV